MVRLLVVPWDSGRHDVRMGAGPTALLRAGAVDRLRERGYGVREQVLMPSGEWQAELTTTFALHRLVAQAVAGARAAGEVPLLLSGNCNQTVGVLAGLGADQRRVGLVWLDAHGDFNTPEEDASGFLDGQGLAMAVGRCWRGATARLPGFAPLPEDDVLLVGARDLTAEQTEVLAGSGLTWLRPEVARRPEAVAAALDALAARVEVVHFHVDLDVHDPSIAPANGYAAPDGLTAQEVLGVLRLAAERLSVVSGTLASFDPAYDPDGCMRAVALQLLTALAEVTAPA
ncbi:arginase family protein [Blastococcus sp. SYSU DS0552]